MMADHGSEAKLLAGGQSLLPMMKLRLVRPAVVVDLNRVTELAYVRDGSDGLMFGATARLAYLPEREAGPLRDRLLDLARGERAEEAGGDVAAERPSERVLTTVPPVLLAAAILITFYIPSGVRHYLAVVVALVFAAGLVFGTLTFWMRRRKNRNT